MPSRRELGVRPGDVVAWLCGNTHELLEAYYGVLLAGAVLLPLNIRLAPAELPAILDDQRRGRPVPSPDQVDPAHPVRDRRARRRSTRRGWPGSPPTPSTRPRSTSTRRPSSSTRRGPPARPRARLLSHRGLYLHAVHNALTEGLTGDDVVLHTIPLFHVNGWGTPHYVTGLGGVHVLLPRFDAGEVLRLVERQRVTRLFLVPAMARLRARPPRRRHRATSRASARSRSAGPPRARRCWPSSRTRSAAR